MFQAYNLLTCFSYAGLFTNLAASSFTYINVLHMERTHYGLMLGGNALCYIAGTFACRRLLRSMGVRRAVAVAGVLSLTAGSIMGLAALADLRSIWAYALPFASTRSPTAFTCPADKAMPSRPSPRLRARPRPSTAW
jgi:DHA1 family bicyclomycin/chloramphenicol resistance-like MFS transporter